MKIVKNLRQGIEKFGSRFTEIDSWSIGKHEVALILQVSYGGQGGFISGLTLQCACMKKVKNRKTGEWKFKRTPTYERCHARNTIQSELLKVFKEPDKNIWRKIGEQRVVLDIRDYNFRSAWNPCKPEVNDRQISFYVHLSNSQLSNLLGISPEEVLQLCSEVYSDREPYKPHSEGSTYFLFKYSRRK